MNRAMRDVKFLIERIAPTRTSVLFLGEQGCGKSYYAEYLHTCGSVERGLFCGVPAKTLTRELLTQIVSRKPETLFFSEVSGLTAEMQKKVFLLSTEFPVRLLASSSFNLETLKDSGLFLPELYGILSALPIVIPPLREREDEILPLACFFLEQFSAGFGKKIAGFTSEAEISLQANNWPTNVCGLRDCIRSACAEVIEGKYIDEVHLGLNADAVSVPFSSEGKSLKDAIDAFKRQYILQVLAETRWNQTEAARLLDIQRTYLSRLIKELKIS